MQATKLIKLLTIIAFSLCLSNCDNKNIVLSTDESKSLNDEEMIKILQKNMNDPFVKRKDTILAIIAIQIKELNTT